MIGTPFYGFLNLLDMRICDWEKGDSISRQEVQEFVKVE
jgi:hypothetical protein